MRERLHKGRTKDAAQKGAKPAVSANASGALGAVRDCRMQTAVLRSTLVELLRRDDENREKALSVVATVDSALGRVQRFLEANRSLATPEDLARLLEAANHILKDPPPD